MRASLEYIVLKHRPGENVTEIPSQPFTYYDQQSGYLNLGYCHYQPLKTGESCSSASARMSVRCCLLYTSPSPRDISLSRMPSSA